jgi:hypothetical protein
MPSARDAFRLAHGGEIREALIMLENEDGGFELLAHGWLDGGDADGAPFALVRSCASNAVHLLLDSGKPDRQHPCRWCSIERQALDALQMQLLRVTHTSGRDMNAA